MTNNNKTKDIIIELKDSIYEFVGEADYGDVGDLGSYWSSIITCLIQYINHLNDDTKIDIESNSSLLDTLEELNKITSTPAMEKLKPITKEIEVSIHNGGSTDYLRSDDMKLILKNIFDFEALFEEVLDNPNESE